MNLDTATPTELRAAADTLWLLAAQERALSEWSETDRERALRCKARELEMLAQERTTHAQRRFDH